MTDKPIPKSLHTVRVLVVMGRTVMHVQSFKAERAVEYSLELLGYVGTLDTHKLAAAAVQQLNKEA